MSDVINAILETAATIGAETKADAEAFAANMKRHTQERASAQDVLNADQRTLSGFNAFRFIGLARVAEAFGRRFNDTTTEAARDTAKAAARSYLASFTGATEKTKAGGREAGSAAVIMMGLGAERARHALQSRLDYWQGVKDGADDMSDKSEAKVQRELANRYLTPCATAPDASGALPTDKSGAVVVPRHKGRTERVVNGVTVPACHGGTNRDSQMAQIAKMYLTHGEAVLNPDVLDALLDNGGKYEHDNNTVEAHASAAAAAIEKLMLAGGSTSSDASVLTLAGVILARIAEQGLKISTVAPSSEPETDSTPPAESTEAPAAEAAEAVEAPPPVAEGGDELDALLAQADETVAAVESRATVKPPARAKKGAGKAQTSAGGGL